MSSCIHLCITFKIHVREKNTLVDCLELSIDVVIAGRGMLPVLILEKVNIKLQECITTDFNFKIEISSLCLD